MTDTTNPRVIDETRVLGRCLKEIGQLEASDALAAKRVSDYLNARFGGPLSPVVASSYEAHRSAHS